tara:strand:- start:120 stop:746 length:627 start_codon:yes stop_codon:yes gene_type:complete
MNLNKSANLALWLIFLVLITPYFLNNKFIRKNVQILNIPNKKLKEENKSIEQNENKLNIENSQKDRYKFRNELAIFTIDRAKEICTEEFIAKAVTQNLVNQKLLMKRMRNVVPNYIKFDWKPYKYKKMSEIIKKENCLDKYKEIVLPYGEELEVKTKLELLQKEPDFYKKFNSMYSWDPDWPNCPEFGYPGCKRISPEKWKSIAIEED